MRFLTLAACYLVILETASMSFGDITLTEATGKKAYCKVFSTGLGSCDYDTLKECNEDLNASDVVCLQNKIGAKGATKAELKKAKADKIAAEEYENDGDDIHNYFKNKKSWHNEAEIVGLPCESVDNYGWMIVKKLDRRHYEAFSQYRDLHGLIETTKTEFTSAGRLTGIKLKRRGFRQMTLENGFEGSVQLYKECSD